MKEQVLLGDEAVALGAIHAGLSAAYGYPGTPSTEIMEYILDYSKKEKGPLATWCSNEKTAYEAALGVSLAGKRSIITMKHVGLNVAADPFMNSASLNIHGGLVLAVADDPGMHSSQSEQDSRYYADFAKIICLEPRNQQEAYEMAREGFELSEKFHIPVMIKLVTRLSHSRAVVKPALPLAENKTNKSRDTTGWVTLPVVSRGHYKELIESQKQFLAYTESSAHTPLWINSEFREFGVITTGLARNYFEEIKAELQEQPSHLHIGAYPMPLSKIRSLAEHVERILVLEEGYPYVERYLRGILPPALTINGKEDGIVPPLGELNPDNTRLALGLPPKTAAGMTEPGELPGRPPQLCAGCPHKDTFDALNAAVAGYPESLVTSDIGCYTLGYLPPYNAVETCVCMGASIPMAKGAANAGLHPVVATLGDSTFMHSGITGLVDAAAENTNMTVIIMDNSTTAMTGGQDTIVTSSRIVDVVKGVGVDPAHIKIITPLRKYSEENSRIIKEELEHPGLSVIIPLRECIHTARQKKKAEV